MQAIWDIPKTMMRKELATNISRMRGIRKEVLADKKMNAKAVERYREQVSVASAYLESLENIEKTGFIKKAITLSCSSDSAFYKYDHSQDRWWTESGQRPEFLTSLWMFSSHLLRSALLGPEDAFHIFQIVKHLYQRDSGMAGNPEFILPAYGGIPVNHEYVGPLLVSMAANKYLLPRKRENNLVLELDWYPDDSPDGIEEVVKLLEAASKLGYFGVEFRAPSELKYEGLYQSFSSLRISHNPECKAHLSCENGGEREFRKGNPFHAIEFEERDAANMPDSEFEGRDCTFLSPGQGSGRLAVGADFSNFASRILFFNDSSTHLFKGGMYFFHDGASDKGNEDMAGIVRAAGPQLFAESPVVSETSVMNFLNGLSEILSRSGFKWQVAYSSLHDKQLGREREFEGFEGSFD